VRVAVTGGTGFLGSHLVEVLRDQGFDVVATGRRVEQGVRDGVSWVAADLSDEASLRRAFEGCDAVVANAALSPGRAAATDQAFVDANERGSVAQIHAAADVGIDRVVYVSTVAVYRTKLFRRLPETAARIDPDAPGFDWNNLTTDPRYAASKAKAERSVWREAAARGVHVTALRPGPIYGERDPKLSSRYGQWMERRVTLAPTLRLPHVHAGDVALATVGALLHPASANRAYNLAGSSESIADILDVWAEHVPAPARRVRVPVPLFIGFDDRAAQRELGFRPRSIEEGVARPARWYASR
jgi:nucleoside-diphosphate-sugar epimerase